MFVVSFFRYRKSDEIVELNFIFLNRNAKLNNSLIRVLFFSELLYCFSGLNNTLTNNIQQTIKHIGISHAFTMSVKGPRSSWTKTITINHKLCKFREVFSKKTLRTISSLIYYNGTMRWTLKFYILQWYSLLILISLWYNIDFWVYLYLKLYFLHFLESFFKGFLDSHSCGSSFTNVGISQKKFSSWINYTHIVYNRVANIKHLL